MNGFTKVIDRALKPAPIKSHRPNRKLIGKSGLAAIKNGHRSANGVKMPAKRCAASNLPR